MYSATRLGLLLWLALGALAIADEPAALSAAERVARARAHYDIARARFDLGDYAAAEREFEEAYRYRPQPSLLYNIGQAARRAGDDDHSLSAFRRYLDEQPRAPERREVERWIVELEQAAAARKPAAPPAPEPPPVVVPPPSATMIVATPPPPRRAIPRFVPWTAGALGVAALITGAALATTSASRYASLHDSCSPLCPPSDFRGLQAREIAGLALVGVGGALTLAGVAVGVVAHRRARAP